MASTEISTQKYSIKGLGKHDVMADLSNDEESLLNYQMTLSKHLREKIQSKNSEIYYKRVEPKFEKSKKRKPKTRHEIRNAMLKDSAYQWWACLRRHLQEQGSSFKFQMIERQSDDLSNAAKEYALKAKLGTLELNKDVVSPIYHTAMDMHWMPGSYYSEMTENDVFPGAMYDLGGLYIGTGGKMGPYNDGPGWAAVNWIKRNYPNFTPSNILDEGCTVGHSTLAYVKAWPNSEVVGIDFAAPVLRYAHARAESMGQKVHYKQMLAEKTEFDSESFDLVLSSMFLHETSNKAVNELVKEAYRILKPGGLMLHVEQPPFETMKTLFEQFEMDWDTHNNNEPFWGPMHDMDLKLVAEKAGFDEEKIIYENCPFVIPLDDGSLKLSETGSWFLFGAWK